MIDIKPQKGMSRSQSNEHLRNFSEGAYRRKVSGNFDPTREHLNFEVGRGGKILPVNQSYSIPKRIEDNLYARGIKDPNERFIKAGQEPKYRTVASFVLGGSTEDMRRLAFGEQNVDFDKDNKPDNSWVKRQKGIEEWAVDVYNFMAKKYGEENIAAFVVHLDESNPHVHCTILPIDKNNKFSYNKVISGGLGKERGANFFRQMHSDFAQINAKYGLRRGDDIRMTGAKHKEYNQYLHEENAKKKKENDKLDEQISDKKEQVKSLDEQIRQLQKKIKSFTTMILNLEIVKKDLTDEIERLTEQRNTMKGDTSKIDTQLARLRKQLDDTDRKIALRKQQLAEANRNLNELNVKTSETRQNLQKLADREFSLSETIEQEETIAQARVKKDMREIGYKAAAYDAEQRFGMLSQNRESWTPEQRDFFDKEIATVFNGSILDSMANESESIIETASQLYLGIISPAQDSNGGGGGSSSSDLRWDGRNKDEDDTDFKIRCFMQSVQMSKSGRSSKKKKGRTY